MWQGADGAATHYARGKCLGGNSARNYMTYHVSTTGAYQRWADAVGDQSYALKNFLPYFEKSQKFTPPNQNTRIANATPAYDLSTLGKGGPLSITFPNYAQAWGTWAAKGLSAIGIKPINGFTSGNLIGQSWSLNTIDATKQTRATSETAFLQPALAQKPNLLVYQSTLAKKVLFDTNKVAIGVQVDSAGEIYTLSAKGEIILSAGSFQSPQLLMVSGVGPEATLKKHGITLVADRPGVGQNMQVREYSFHGEHGPQRNEHVSLMLAVGSYLVRTIVSCQLHYELVHRNSIVLLRRGQPIQQQPSQRHSHQSRNRCHWYAFLFHIIESNVKLMLWAYRLGEDSQVYAGKPYRKICGPTRRIS